MARQHTIADAFSVEGISLHSGSVVSVRILPAEPDTGIVFRSAAGLGDVAAHVDNVQHTLLATSLGNGAWQVRTVEHLLAALAGEHVDNVVIEVTGDEIPVLDGSAGPWVEHLRSIGRRAQAAPRRVIAVRQPIEVRDGERLARLLPNDRCELAATIDFEHPLIGAQKLEVAVDNGGFARELAWARTFGFLAEVEGMRAAGLIRGGSLDNAVVFGPESVMNPEGMRAPDEPVRHKLLDMLGDLALAGHPVRARFEAELPGHTLTRLLVAALLERPDCWEVVDT